MLNNDSTYLDDICFYENVIKVNNIRELLVDEKTHTYSIEKFYDLLVIDKIIPDNHLNVFQMSFSIENLKDDSTMETGITETQIYNSQKETGYIRKSINIRGLLLENYNIYKDFNILEQWEKLGFIGKKKQKKFIHTTNSHL
jgi:hypothetical protein